MPGGEGRAAQAGGIGNDPLRPSVSEPAEVGRPQPGGDVGIPNLVAAQDIDPVRQPPQAGGKSEFRMPDINQIFPAESGHIGPPGGIFPAYEQAAEQYQGRTQQEPNPPPPPRRRPIGQPPVPARHIKRGVADNVGPNAVLPQKPFQPICLEHCAEIVGTVEGEDANLPHMSRIPGVRRAPLWHVWHFQHLPFLEYHHSPHDMRGFPTGAHC